MGRGSDVFGVAVGLKLVTRNAFPSLFRSSLTPKPLSTIIEELKPVVEQTKHSLEDEKLRSQNLNDIQDLPQLISQDSITTTTTIEQPASLQQSSTNNIEQSNISSTIEKPRLQSIPIQNVDQTRNMVNIKQNQQIEKDEVKPFTTQELEDFPQILLHSSAKEVAVPSSKVSRLFHYGGLVAGLGFGAAGEAFKRMTGSVEKKTSSVFISEANAERLVKTLSKMRGAALKMGQILSMQDSSAVPRQIQDILERVRLSADYMPKEQREEVLRTQLGDDWKEKFLLFEEKPMSAASIGQVHRAKLLDGTDVVVKIQYPGVAESILNDLQYLKSLLFFSNFLPKGMYLETTIKVAAVELAWETDYLREAHYATKFYEFLKDDPSIRVPFVVPELTTNRVITLEMLHGMSIDKYTTLPLEIRTSIAQRILKLCLKEIFEFRTMQTDPNWSNFLFNPKTGEIGLIDFGASREFSKAFTDKYLRILLAAQNQDKEEILKQSYEIGFLTGDETQVMKDAHAKAVLILGEVFSKDTEIDFATQDISARVQSLIPVMLNHRLKPPPEETYSLHRKISGAFLLCTKLNAKINCRKVFDSIIENYKFDD